MTSGTNFSISDGELVEAVDAAGHRVTGGVVAADDQQQQVAEVLKGRHVLGVLTVGKHGDEIKAGLATTLVPQLLEIGDALEQLVDLLLLGFDDATRSGDGEHDVRPAGELAAILHREVEEGGEHEGRELDRDHVDPVERLVLGE